MPTSFKLHTPSLWGRFPVINLWSASPIGDNSHQGFFCSSLHSHRRRYSTVYTGTVVLLALSKLCFMCKISGDGAPFSSIVAITTFKRSLSQLAFHLVFKIFMWHPNSGDILLHILEAYSENHMKMFAWFLQSVLSRLEKDCNSCFCSRSHSKTKVWVHPNPQPFYLFTEHSLSLFGTNSVLPWLQRQSSLISTRWHTCCFSDIRSRTSFDVCVILSRVKGKTLITWHGLIMYTSLVSYSVSTVF